eukprot:6650524-Pyramimonas_sp.AAC.1
MDGYCVSNCPCDDSMDCYADSALSSSPECVAAVCLHARCFLACSPLRGAEPAWHGPAKL